MAEKEYIEREALKSKLKNMEATSPNKVYQNAMEDMIYYFIPKIIDEIPTADVEPVRHGRWVLLRESEITGFNPELAGLDPIGGYQCSNCKKEAIFDCNDEFVLSSYCPNCGARMDGDADANGNDNKTPET